MRKHLGAMAFGIAALSGSVQRAPAADMGMIMLPDAKSVQWNPAPPSLPISAKISLLAGDPAQPGPSTLRLQLPAKTTILQVTGTGPFDLHYINPADDPRNDKSDPRNKQ